MWRALLTALHRTPTSRLVGRGGQFPGRPARPRLVAEARATKLNGPEPLSLVEGALLDRPETPMFLPLSAIPPPGGSVIVGRAHVVP
jgi:hypothetical protein